MTLHALLTLRSSWARSNRLSLRRATFSSVVIHTLRRKTSHYPSDNALVHAYSANGRKTSTATRPVTLSTVARLITLASAGLTPGR